MGGVVVHDQVKLDALAGVRVGGVAVGPVDLSQEGAELLVAVPGARERRSLPVAT